MTPSPSSSFEIRFPGPGASLRGALAVPSQTPAPGVVLIPDVRGVSDLYRRLGDRLAAQGFTVLTLDLYSREGAPDLADPAAAMRWIAQLPDERVLGDIAAAATHLAARAEVGGRSLGIAGFCMGGQYALMAACREPSFAACVSFYGMLRYDRTSPLKPASPLDLAARLACPLLGLYGADDDLIPAADRLALERTLTSARAEFSLHVFGGAGHAFLNDTRPDAFRPETAAIAWRLATDFLAAKLA